MLVPLDAQTRGGAPPARRAAPSTPGALTQVFTDRANGYSVRYPATWKAQPAADRSSPLVLTLVSPLNARLFVSVYPLPSRVVRYSSTLLERIGHDHVDTVVSYYKTQLKVKTVLREQPEDHSDERAMIFWQGTSAIDGSGNDWAIVSTHAIRYGTATMVNLVYVGNAKTAEDGAAMDAVMGSLSFDQ
jgi:hypothetical protein